VAPWILYCIATFGFAGTFGANSTVRSAAEEGAPYPLVVAGNLLSSTFPTNVRHVFPDFARSWYPVLLSADASGRWSAHREDQDPFTLWMIDLVNGNFSILGTLGLAGMLTILAAAIMWDRRRQAHPSAPPMPPPALPGPASLWISLLAAGIILTVMAYPRYADNGLRGAGLHLYILLMPLLAVRQLRDAPRALLASLIVVFLVESAIVSGAFLALQTRQVPLLVTDTGFVALPGTALDALYIKNYYLKRASGLMFLSDYLGQARLMFSLLTTVLAIAAFTIVATSNWPRRCEPIGR
jgi:hypothetical protein